MSAVIVATVGTVSGSYGAHESAGAQKDAANSAGATQLELDRRAREDNAPWLKAGTAGLNELAGALGLEGYTSKDFTKDPGYQFQLDEGNKGLNASLAARGGLLSGAALKAASKYNQDYASNYYDKRMNRLASIAGVGQTAAGDNASGSRQLGRDLAENQIGAGNARASGYMGMTNAINSGIGTGVNLYQGNQMLKYLKGSGQPEIAVPMTAPSVTWSHQ